VTTTCLPGVVLLVAAVSACSSSSGNADAGDAAKPADTGPHTDGSLHDAGSDVLSHDAGRDAAPHDAVADGAFTRIDAAECTSGCPTGYVCSTANGLPVCRAPSGVPLLTHVFLIMEENTSLSTLLASENANAAPNFEAMRKKYATGSGYHGVGHPSLPNYIALTSGGTQGLTCDCFPVGDAGACTGANCSLIENSCDCPQTVKNLADQLETANKSWTAFGEGMGTPCNLFDSDAGNYAVRHVPFLYYDDIQTDLSRCTAHVIDYASFDPKMAPDFTYIAPNLIDDMHNPVPATQGNITNGDTWIAPVVAEIIASSAYKDGGLLVIVWDEDDDSGLLVKDATIPIYVLSPYAKSGGYVSAATLDHYSLLATIEDGMNLPRLGSAGVPRPSTADTLADFFAPQ